MCLFDIPICFNVTRRYQLFLYFSKHLKIIIPQVTKLLCINSCSTGLDNERRISNNLHCIASYVKSMTRDFVIDVNNTENSRYDFHVTVYLSGILTTHSVMISCFVPL